MEERASEPVRRPRRALPILLVALLASGALTACAGEANTAQEGMTVPEDPAVVSQRADRSRIRGDTAAPIRVVEISDFQCPYCEQFNRETFPAIDSLYVQPGLVEYIWISFANASHAYAWPAIEAAFCAGATGEFWPMHDLLFENQETWSESDAPVVHFEGYAEEIGLDSESFSACLREDRPAALQLQDFQSINQAGISGTPFFIINDEIPAQGALTLDRFRSVLDSILVAQGESVPPGSDRESGDASGEDGSAPTGEEDSAPNGSG